jgi:hypothetical protein
MSKIEIWVEPEHHTDVNVIINTGFQRPVDDELIFGPLSPDTMIHSKPVETTFPDLLAEFGFSRLGRLRGNRAGTRNRASSRFRTDSPICGLGRKSAG